jgi:chromosome partitioning protein
VANQKGGVGKSKTAQYAARGLAGFGYRVLAVDFDPQSSLSKAMLPGYGSDMPNIAGVLENLYPWSNAIVTVAGTLHVLPSSYRLEAVKRELTIDALGALKLRQLLDEIETGMAAGGLALDAIIIDTPPDLGSLTLAAIVAATDLLIPTQAEDDSIAGIASLRACVDDLAAKLSPFGWKAPQCLGSVATMVESEVALHKRNIAVIAGLPGLPLLAQIPKRKGANRDGALTAAYWPVVIAMREAIDGPHNGKEETDGD